MFEKAGKRLSSIEKKKETVQRQKEVAIQTFALIPKDIDNNKTILYYRSEKERVTRKIEDLERERQRYESEILIRTQRLENAEPDTPAFRKLKAEETQLEQELKEAEEEFSRTKAIFLTEQDKREKNRQMVAMEEFDRQERQRLAIEQAEREKIEEQNRKKQEEVQRKYDEAFERAGRVKAVDHKQPEEQDYVKLAIDSLKNAFPERRGLIKHGKKGKQLTLEELNRNTMYSVLDLDTITIDYDIHDEKKIELWEELRTAAAKREKLPGWWMDK